GTTLSSASRRRPLSAVLISGRTRLVSLAVAAAAAATVFLAAGAGTAAASCDITTWGANGYNAGSPVLYKASDTCNDINVKPLSQGEDFKGCWYQHYCASPVYAPKGAITSLWGDFTTGQPFREWTTDYGINQSA